MLFSPRQSLNDLVHLRGSNSELAREGAVTTISGPVPFADLSSFLHRQFCVSAPAHVLHMEDCLKVIRIDAMPHSTKVIDDVSVGNLPLRDSVVVGMGLRFVEDSIPVFVQTSLPKPTVTCWIDPVVVPSRAFPSVVIRQKPLRLPLDISALCFALTSWKRSIATSALAKARWLWGSVRQVSTHTQQDIIHRVIGVAA